MENYPFSLQRRRLTIYGSTPLEGSIKINFSSPEGGTAHVGVEHVCDERGVKQQMVQPSWGGRGWWQAGSWPVNFIASSSCEAPCGLVTNSERWTTLWCYFYLQGLFLKKFGILCPPRPPHHAILSPQGGAAGITVRSLTPSRRRTAAWGA